MSLDTTTTTLSSAVSGDEANAAISSFELGASVVTLIAHPAIADDRESLERMLCQGPRIEEALGGSKLTTASRQAIRTRMLLGGAGTFVSIRDPWRSERVIPAYAFRDPAAMIDGLEKLEPLWSAGMRVGELFLRLAAECGSGEGRGSKSRLLSLDGAMKHMMPESTAYDRKNFLDRVWRPRRRVAHLAAAVWSLNDCAREHWGVDIAPPHLMFTPALLREVLNRAEKLAELVESSSMRAKFTDVQLVRILPPSA